MDEDAFEVGDAAAGSFGGEAGGHPSDETAGKKSDRGEHRPSPVGMSVKSFEKMSAPCLSKGQRAAECHGQEAGA